MNHLLLYDGKEYPQGVAYAECHNSMASDLRMLKQFNEIRPTKRPELVCVACSDRELFSEIIDAHASIFPTIYISNLPDYRGMKPRTVYDNLLAQGKDAMGADTEDVKQISSVEVAKQPEAQPKAEEIKPPELQESPKIEKPAPIVPPSSALEAPKVKRASKKEEFPTELKITKRKK